MGRVTPALSSSMGFLHGLAMKLLVISALLGVCLAYQVQGDYAKLQFISFKEEYGKQYRTRTEHNLRFNIFKANLDKIIEHNQSGASWTMGVNLLLLLFQPICNHSLQSYYFSSSHSTHSTLSSHSYKFSHNSLPLGFYTSNFSQLSHYFLPPTTFTPPVPSSYMFFSLDFQ